MLGPAGVVRVRARSMKAHERERYTLERCALEAKFLFAAKPPPSSMDEAAASPLPGEAKDPRQMKDRGDIAEATIDEVEDEAQER